MVTGVNIGPSLIGDALFAEPALRALAFQQQKPIPLYIEGPAKELYAGHPCIEFSTENPSFTPLGPGPAFAASAQRGEHIALGYYHQLGLDPRGQDSKPCLPEWPIKSDRETDGGYIVIAPFSASCSVHTTGIANKTIELSWWESLVDKLGVPVYSLGGKDEPLVSGTINWRGESLHKVGALLAGSDCLIAGDTGITAIAGALNCNIVLLSSAVPPWLTGPQTKGGFVVVQDPGSPPKWRHKDVLKAVKHLCP